MRDSTPGKEAGHGEVEDKARADRDAPAANRSGHREWEEHRAGLQGGRGHRADVLPLAEGVRGVEAGPGAAAEGAREGKCPPEAGGGGPGPGEAGAAGRRPGKLLSLERRRSAVAYARGQYGLSERHACRLLGQWRGSQRYTPTQRGDEDALTRPLSPWLASTGATATGGSPRCSSTPGGTWGRTGGRASGGARG